MKYLALLITLTCVLWTGARAETAQDFSRYQIIIDRSPFGAVKTAAVDSAANTPTFQRYQLVAIVVSNGGLGPVQAGIFDRESNRSYYLAAGESIDTGLKVIKIDERPPVKVELMAGLERAQLTFQDRPSTPAAPVAGGIRPPFTPGNPSPNPPPPPRGGRVPAFNNRPR